MAKKLTPAQRAVLAKMKAGAKLVRPHGTRYRAFFVNDRTYFAADFVADRTMSALSTGGFIEVVGNDDDRHRYIFGLTEAGRAAIDQGSPAA